MQVHPAVPERVGEGAPLTRDEPMPPRARSTSFNASSRNAREGFCRCFVSICPSSLLQEVSNQTGADPTLAPWIPQRRRIQTRDELPCAGARCRHGVPYSVRRLAQTGRRTASARERQARDSNRPIACGGWRHTIPRLHQLQEPPRAVITLEPLRSSIGC